MKNKIVIACVGDIAFEGRNAESPKHDVFSKVRDVLRNVDIAIGNLEGPLTERGIATSGKCSLRGKPEWAAVLKNAGFGFLSLANNHMMDYGEEGLRDTFTALESNGIKYVGAGRDEGEAQTPLLIDMGGCRISIIARSSVDVSSRCYADASHAGVAFLDEEETVSRIRACRRNSDHVILLLHWGVEDYQYPTPKQRKIARSFIEAGADIVLGHHPHVLQGVERINKGVVAYSVGNFLFDEFEWKYSMTDSEHTVRSHLSPLNREGVILLISISTDKEIVINQIYTLIDNAGRLSLDSDPERTNKMLMYSHPLSKSNYVFWWKYYSAKKELTVRVLPLIAGRNILKNIKRIRPRHFGGLCSTIFRSFKIITGRSTNPYE